jgi:AcrR family transcriptional regulator
MARPKTVPESAIVGATSRVLARLGPNRFTLAHVAREVGLAPATLVQRYGSKRGLLLAFAQSAANNATAPFRKASEAHASPRLALLDALTYATHQLSSRELTSRQQVANGLAVLLNDLEDPDLLAAASAHAKATQTAIRELLDAAVKTHELRQVNTEVLSLSIQAAWNGAIIQWALRGEGDFETFLAEVLAPLLPSPPESTRKTPKQ